MVQRIAGLETDQMVAWANTAASLVNPSFESDSENLVTIILREAVPALLRMEERLRVLHSAEAMEAWVHILRALVITCTVEGGTRLLSAIAAGRQSSHYLWAFIFSDLRTGSIQRNMLFKAYKNRLPPEPFAAHFLSLGNAICLRKKRTRHPLDLPSCEMWFQKWLADPGTDETTTIDAVVALAFLRQPWATKLQEEALEHSSKAVQLEAAWVSAKSGSKKGVEMLVSDCSDFRHTLRAQAYLNELGHGCMIPPVCKDAEFTAKASLSAWLDNPDSGYSCPADKIDVVWRTRAVWPGNDTPTNLFVLEYCVKDRWELLHPGRGFGVGVDCHPPRLIWCHELTMNSHLEYEDMAASGIYHMFKDREIQHIFFEEDLAEYTFLLSHWQGAALSDPELEDVALVDPPIPGLPTIFAVMNASIGNNPGWAIIESPSTAGTSSFWYEAKLRPASSSTDILAEHVGRRLLKWPLRCDAPSVVEVPPSMPWPPDHLANCYEKMLRRAVQGGEDQRYWLFEGRLATIPDFLPAYVEAVTAIGELERFRETANLLIPICKDDRTKCLLVPYLVKIGEKEKAARLFESLQNPEFNQSLCFEALHALERTSEVLDRLKEYLQSTHGDFCGESKNWTSSQKKTAAETYLWLVGLLEKYAENQTEACLAQWGLPKRLP